MAEQPGSGAAAAQTARPRRGRRWGASALDYCADRPCLGYAVAVAGTALATWLRSELGRLFGADVPMYLTFYPVILGGALLGGLRPGLLATGLSALGAFLFFLEPRRPGGLPDPGQLAGLCLFLLIGLLFSWGGGALRAARRQQQAAARQAEQAAHALRETIDLLDLAAVLTLDLEGRIVRWSAGCRRLYGFTAEQALGRISHELLQTRFPEPREALQARVLQAGRWEGEMQQRTADGRELSVQSEWVLWRNTTGRPTAILETNTDVTARKRAEEEIRRLNASLEQQVAERTAALWRTIGELEHFSYSLTHNLRAPLRAMRSFAELTLTEARGYLAEPHRDYLERIARSAARMDQLIRGALDYSRALRTELPVEPVDLAGLLRELIESYPVLHPHRAHIRLEPPFPRVLGNAAALTQCLAGLLENAVIYTRPNEPPQVRVWTESDGDGVRLCVEDHGIGIAPEALAHLFDLFRRAHAERSGMGIGLALVAKLAERMGGRVGVTSTPGVGSRFWLELKRVA